MFRRAKTKRLLFSFVVLMIVAGMVVVVGFGILPKKTNPPVSQVTNPALNACKYLTNKEAGALLGQTPGKAPINSDTSGGMKDVQVASCEYPSTVGELVIHIAKGATPEAIAEEHKTSGQPIDPTLEEPYIVLGRNGFITKEHIGEGGVQILASARFPIKDGSVQVNAATFDIVEKVMTAILPKIDAEQ